MEKEIVYYYTEDGLCPFFEWYNALDKSIKLRVDKRIDKLKEGLYGDSKQLQDSELSELRLNFGAGYRIYYKDLDDMIVMFITGSNKKEQKKIIQQANNYYSNFVIRKNKEIS